MWPCATTAVASNGDDGTGTDMGALSDNHLGEVAVADGEVAMTKSDIQPGALVLTNIDNFTVHHGVCGFVVCFQIKPIV